MVKLILTTTIIAIILNIALSFFIKNIETQDVETQETESIIEKLKNYIKDNNEDLLISSIFIGLLVFSSLIIASFLGLLF